LKTVFIPPIVNFDFLKQLPQQMAQQFARNGYKVIYCNNNINGRYGHKEVEPNLFVYGNANEAFEYVVEKRVKIDIFYTTWAKTSKQVDIVEPKLVIYQSCDSFSEWKPFEQEMIDKSHIVLCTSEYIYNMRKEQHNNVHIVRNGCNQDMINTEWKTPEDMKFIKNPIFLFCGAIGKWVDTTLIKAIGENYITVFIGREFGKECPQGIFNLGVKSHDDLINYYNASDIGLLPFRISGMFEEVTRAASPVKMWEYLACGLPILATSWEETELPELKGVVFTANTKEEYLEKADYLANLSPEERSKISEKAKQIASENTWEKRFEVIDKLIKERI